MFNNPDWGNAQNVNVSLSSSNNNITFINPNVNFGNINSGDVAINIENPFNIVFESNINIGEVELIANVISNEDNYIAYNTTFSVILNIEEASIILGDLNFDNITNILDVVQLVSLILNNNGTPNQVVAADLNQDNIINIQDIILLINQILG